LRSRDYKILISLREDFLPDLESWSALIPSLARSRVRLLPMEEDAAIKAVYQPGRNLLEKGQAELIVKFIAGARNHGDESGLSDDRGDAVRSNPVEQVEPALLSLFCRELNEERKR